MCIMSVRMSCWQTFVWCAAAVNLFLDLLPVNFSMIFRVWGLADGMSRPEIAEEIYMCAYVYVYT